MVVYRKYFKDPGAALDYRFEWGTPSATEPPWLASGETISTKSVTVPAGLSLDDQQITDDGKSVLVWLSGGTAGINYDVHCLITTSQSRTDVRTMSIYVTNR